ncbi:hypothetical protein FE257_012953 [Aspergillus nanangensis]|uniref:Xylanolytic transcriptional activator regulatory domain-containing protein n=1 Tax=Aspergillus nanangensis TaxID=2582783 RepID=A0AAD4GQE3_ASPNN|nr:hypothetical protein FE257_012953 [Aspergillus nanangensis]
MSNYYVGPFGLPGSHPYQLPPPRTTLPLQFGSDPFLHQRSQGERNSSGGAPSSSSKTPGPQSPPNEQLPSVSQLLTPGAHESRPSSPWHPTAFGIYLGPTISKDSHPSNHTDSGLSSNLPRNGIHDISRVPSDLGSQPGSLPPLAHLPTLGLPREADPLNPASYSTPSYPYGPASTHGFRSVDLDAGGDGAQEAADFTEPTTGKSKRTKVRPHVVDERYIDGEGLCYIYADGSHCPKLIDGVAVNANWGITKAGKPRKRLAQANLGESADLKARTNSQSPISDGSMLTPSAMDGTQESLGEPEYPYRPRLYGLGRVSGGAEDLTRRPGTNLSPDYSEILIEMKDLDPQDPVASDWNMDPYEADSELAIHYVESYFTYVNDRLYYLFPRRRFLLWLKSCHTKSLDDKMLLYTMMTLGSVFSDRPDRFIALKRYSRTARYAVGHSQYKLSLQLAQSRIILSLWYYAIGAHVRSWDEVGAAVRTVTGLRYNVESGGVIVEQPQACEYGLHPQALIECRRRTFWVAFLLDRLSCFYTPSSTFIPSQTAYLRLPCREEVYEAQQYTTVPYFQPFLNQLPVSPEDEVSGISAMAILIEVMSLWGDVSDHVFRLSLIPAEAYGRLFEDFHSTIVRRADEWTARLPDHLIFTAMNMERSIRAKKADAFISIHMLYHATLMKLNRHARYQNLPDALVDRHVHTTRTHAVEILRISHALLRYASDYESTRITLEPAPVKGTILNPFLGYVILSAVDVLSAGGLMVEISECTNLIRSGLAAVRELGRFWDGSIPLASLIETRLEAMTEYLHHPMEADGKLAFLTNSASLDSQVRSCTYRQDIPGNEDLMYSGLPRERLFRALDVGSTSFAEDIILWVIDSS